MRIAIDISQVQFEGTGVATYTRELVKNILKNDKENKYLLFALTWRQRKPLLRFIEEIKLYKDNFDFRLLPVPQSIGNPLWNRFHQIKLEWILGKFNILHSSDWIQPPTDAKKVTTVHDLIVYKHPQTSHPKIVATHIRRLYWVKKECDMIIVDSNSTKKDLINILNIDPSKLTVVYPGLGDRFKDVDRGEKERIRQKYQLPEGYILTVGTREPRKNIASVIEAFYHFLEHSLITSHHKSAKLVIVGKFGWGEAPKADKHIRVLGFVPEEDLPGLYSNASLFVYPSLYEGFGLPVLEAMSCSCPVITTDRGSLKEIASDSAIVVDPDSINDIAVQMVKLMIDNNLRQKLIDKGKKNVKKFNWTETSLNVINIYRNLIK